MHAYMHCNTSLDSGMKAILGAFSFPQPLQSSKIQMVWVYSGFRLIIPLFDSLCSARNNFHTVSGSSYVCKAQMHCMHVERCTKTLMHALKHAHCAVQMSEAPMSVLNCNGPYQIKGKVLYVLRQTQLIFHQA